MQHSELETTQAAVETGRMVVPLLVVLQWLLVLEAIELAVVVALVVEFAEVVFVEWEETESLQFLLEFDQMAPAPLKPVLVAKFELADLQEGTSYNKKTNQNRQQSYAA